MISPPIRRKSERPTRGPRRPAPSERACSVDGEGIATGAERPLFVLVQSSGNACKPWATWEPLAVPARRTSDEGQDFAPRPIRKEAS